MQQEEGFQKCREILMEHTAVMEVAFEPYAASIHDDIIEIIARCWSEAHKQKFEVGFTLPKPGFEHDDVIEKAAGYIIDEVDRQLRIGPN